MRNELRHKIAERYLEMYNQFDIKSMPGEVSFRDMAPNLVCSLISYANLLDNKGLNPEKIKQYKRGFVRDLRATKDYFRFLEERPDFFESETTKTKGHFPKLWDIAYCIGTDSSDKQNKLFGVEASHAYYVYLIKKEIGGRE